MAENIQIGKGNKGEGLKGSAWIKVDGTMRRVKLAIFDFDETLAIHFDKGFVQHRAGMGEVEYFRQAFCGPENFYDAVDVCSVSRHLQALIAHLRRHGVKMYCLSGMRTTLHAEAKQAFIRRHYGDNIKLLSAHTQEYKVEVVDVLKAAFACEPQEILFVDDQEKVIDLMQQRGYLGILAGDVNNVTLIPSKG